MNGQWRESGRVVVEFADDGVFVGSRRDSEHVHIAVDRAPFSRKQQQHNNNITNNRRVSCLRLERRIHRKKTT